MSLAHGARRVTVVMGTRGQTVVGGMPWHKTSKLLRGVVKRTLSRLGSGLGLGFGAWAWVRVRPEIASMILRALSTRGLSLQGFRARAKVSGLGLRVEG